MTDAGPKNRQELYDRIRRSSKDEVIVEEMVRLGFWETEALPDDPVDDIQRIGELERQLRALISEQSRLHDVDAMKKEARRRRLAEAKARREETKRRREEERAARAEAWAARKQQEILYLGEGVSTALGKREGQARPGLPDVQDAASLAAAMGITVGELRWLTFHRRVSETSHYARFRIPKKTGGTRLISAPMPRLKDAQRWVLEQILEPVPLHDAAHGFVAGRSIVTNAAAHVGREVVVNLDLKDFFPTLTFPRVRGVFQALGYSPEVATLLGLLCTEPEVAEVELDGRRWFVHRSERFLPQGSPCSPAITNLVCRRLDQRLAGLAEKLGFTYTRYADDLTFSGAPDRVRTLLKAVDAIVTDEGFTVHPDKTRVMRRGGCQEVTGLVVNDRLGVPRRMMRRWRAVLHQVRHGGVEGRSFGPGNDVMASLLGFAALVKMVDPDRGAAMLTDARLVADGIGWSAPKRREYGPRRAWPGRAGGAPANVGAAGGTGGGARDAAGEPGVDGVAAAPGADHAAESGAADEPSADKPKWWEFWRWGS